MPMQAKRNGGGIAPTHSKPGTGRRWVVSTTPRPLYPLEKSGTSCTWGCVDLGAGLDGTKNIAPTGIRSSEYINRTLKSEFFRLRLFWSSFRKLMHGSGSLSQKYTVNIRDFLKSLTSNMWPVFRSVRQAKGNDNDSPPLGCKLRHFYPATLQPTFTYHLFKTYIIAFDTHKLRY